MNNPFFQNEEQEVVDRFLRDGYYIFPIADRKSLDTIRETLHQKGLTLLDSGSRPDEKTFFDSIQNYVAVDKLNDFRVKLIAHLAKQMDLRSKVYHLGKKHIDWIIGNEIAMQRACNLSIQLPGDDSSLLPVHSDVWSGNSPYEIVFWLPLVDCHETKSMFILPREESDEVYRNFKKYSKLTAEEFFKAIEPRVTWVDVPYGHGLIFSHVMPHGNRVNQEKHTRWTINVRFKGMLSPYGSKELGESFLPVTARPATRIGYAYSKPEVAYDGK